MLFSPAFFLAISTVTQSPVTRVIELVRKLKVDIEHEGEEEKAVYDKFAGWCEETTKRKEEDISAASDRIDDLDSTIEERSGQKGSYVAQLAQLKKEIEENITARNEAEALRKKQTEAFEKEKTESEQCITALEGAIKTLTGAGVVPPRQRELLPGEPGGSNEAGAGPTDAGVAPIEEVAPLESLAGLATKTLRAGIAHALQLLPKESKAVTEEERQQLAEFLAQIEGQKAALLQNNPFGDYAPASDRIQGILKNMLDSFRANLDRSIKDEARNKELFEGLMETKTTEFDTLSSTLEMKQTGQADNTETLASQKQERYDLKEQRNTDKSFLADTKKNCRDNANAWAERTRLRTEELAGIEKAIELLSSQESKGAAFLQLSKTKPQNTRAYELLSALAKKNNSLRLAALAVRAKSTEGGHFDQVIRMVDKMIKAVREEDADDIKSKDRCQTHYEELKSEKSDVEQFLKKNKNSLELLQKDTDSLSERMANVEKERETVKKEISTAVEERAAARNEFQKTLAEDRESVQVIGQAIDALQAFYQNNGISPASLMQISLHVQAKNPEDQAPEGFAGKDYGGKKSQTSNILVILAMLKEDVENEIQASIKTEEEAQKDFETTKAAAEANLQALKKTGVNIAKLQAATSWKISLADKESGNLTSREEVNKASFEAHCGSCDWIYSTDSAEFAKLTEMCPALKVEGLSGFQDRKDKRKLELQGLLDAKNALSGAESV